MSKQGNSGISWTDATLNLVTGCTPVSEGCRNCYAARYAKRGIGDFKGKWKVKADGKYSEKISRPFSDIRCHPERLELPLHWRKPRRIFVCSMGDLFHEQVPDKFIDQVFAVIAQCQRHTFQILTKRPKRMRDWLSHIAWKIESGVVEILPNAWLGVSAENQDMADERIPLLLQTPAAVRWVSLEPLLGPVDMSRWLGLVENKWGIQAKYQPDISWCVVGGESGPGARPCHPNWVRSIRNQCQSAGMAFHFKQWGEWLPDDQTGIPMNEWVIKPGHPGAPKEMIDKPVCWLSPGLHGFRVGKKAAGRVLDGKEWLEFPQRQS